LLDAMRKLAKKRETMLQKQQHGMFGIEAGHIVPRTLLTYSFLSFPPRFIAQGQ
jgi:hypothetical protein